MNVFKMNDEKRSLVTHMEPIQKKFMKAGKNVVVALSNASLPTTCDTLDENRQIELQVVDSLITGVKSGIIELICWRPSDPYSDNLFQFLNFQSDSAIVGKTNNEPFVPNQQLQTEQDDQQQPAAPLFVTRQKESQEQPELETRKAFENFKASNSESPSDKFGQCNISLENPTLSDKVSLSNLRKRIVLVIL